MFLYNQIQSVNFFYSTASFFVYITDQEMKSKFTSYCLETKRRSKTSQVGVKCYEPNWSPTLEMGSILVEATNRKTDEWAM